MFNQKIVLRADGSPAIGYGHIYRMIALLKMLYKDFECVFASDDTHGFLLNELKGLNVPFLKLDKINYPLPDTRQTGDEVPFDMAAILNGNEMVVLDGYWFGTAFQQAVKKKDCRLINIDDLYEPVFFSDLIINQAPAAKANQYKAQAYTDFALGLNYVLLRPPFLKAATESRTRNTIANENVLICFGGTDFLNYSAIALEAAQQFGQFKKITVVTGAGYQYCDEINKAAAKDKRIAHLHAIDENKMAAQFAEADICVVPSSGVLLEALVSGRQVISGCYANNQKGFYKSFLDAGLIEGVEEFTKESIYAALEKVLAVKTKPIHKIIDGNSPIRIRNKFLWLACHLRKAEGNDATTLFNWANDTDVRQNAVNKQPVLWDGHLRWFNKKIQSETSVLYILEAGETPVGQVRLDEENGSWWIDYSVDKNYRGYGLGSLLLKKALAVAPGKKIEAIVREGNKASEKVFQKLGFIKTGNRNIQDEMYNHFEIQL